MLGCPECKRAALHSRSGGCGARHRDNLGHFAQVLGCGGEVELIFCAIGTTQAQAVQLEDALEMGEQHFDLLPLAARHEVGVGVGDVARHIARALVDRAHDLAGGHFGRAALLERTGLTVLLARPMADEAVGMKS